MTTTILDDNVTTDKAFDLDALIADALAKHDAAAEVKRIEEAERERRKEGERRQTFLAKALTVLPPYFLRAVTLEKIGVRGDEADFVRNGVRYRIWETSHNHGGGHMGWAISQVVSDGGHNVEHFSDVTFANGLLVYIGKVERMQKRAASVRAAYRISKELTP